jgi:hypothetical protein
MPFMQTYCQSVENLQATENYGTILALRQTVDIVGSVVFSVGVYTSICFYTYIILYYTCTANIPHIMYAPA